MSNDLRQNIAMIAFTALILSAAALARPDHGTAGLSGKADTEDLATVQQATRTDA